MGIPTEGPCSTEHHAERVRQHGEALEVLSQALSGIEQQRREPDAWERDNLLFAIGLVLRGGYIAVQAVVAHAQTPPNERMKLADNPDLAVADLRFLQSALAEAAAQPVRDYATVAPWHEAAARLCGLRPASALHGCPDGKRDARCSFCDGIKAKSSWPASVLSYARIACSALSRLSVPSGPNGLKS
jgi:hypothetical protein